MPVVARGRPVREDLGNVNASLSLMHLSSAMSLHAWYQTRRSREYHPRTGITMFRVRTRSTVCAPAESDTIRTLTGLPLVRPYLAA
jgi:hypothetical protein